MAFKIIHLQQRQRSRAWSADELAECYRVVGMLSRAGLPVSMDSGVTDEGDPWAIVFREDTGDVLLHMARLDGQFVVVSSAGPSAERGTSLRAVLDMAIQSGALAAFRQSRLTDGAEVLRLHPATVMAAFIAAAWVYTEMNSTVLLSTVGRRDETGPDARFVTTPGHVSAAVPAVGTLAIAAASVAAVAVAFGGMQHGIYLDVSAEAFVEAAFELLPASEAGTPPSIVAAELMLPDLPTVTPTFDISLAQAERGLSIEPNAEPISLCTEFAPLFLEFSELRDQPATVAAITQITAGPALTWVLIGEQILSQQTGLPGEDAATITASILSTPLAHTVAQAALADQRSTRHAETSDEGLAVTTYPNTYKEAASVHILPTVALAPHAAALQPTTFQPGTLPSPPVESAATAVPLHSNPIKLDGGILRPSSDYSSWLIYKNAVTLLHLDKETTSFESVAVSDSLAGKISNYPTTSAVGTAETMLDQASVFLASSTGNSSFARVADGVGTIAVRRSSSTGAEAAGATKSDLAFATDRSIAVVSKDVSMTVMYASSSGSEGTGLVADAASVGVGVKSSLTGIASGSYAGTSTASALPAHASAAVSEGIKVEKPLIEPQPPSNAQLLLEFTAGPAHTMHVSASVLTSLVPTLSDTRKVIVFDAAWVEAKSFMLMPGILMVEDELLGTRRIGLGDEGVSLTLNLGDGLTLKLLGVLDLFQDA